VSAKPGEVQHLKEARTEFDARCATGADASWPANGLMDYFRISDAHF